MIKSVLLKVLWFYQKFVTVVFGYGACRYYPSCSEYAKQQFENNPLHTALYRSSIRILTCNQMFPGGIDYPILHKLKENPASLTIDKVKYFLVPAPHNRYHIIKNFIYKG